LQQTTNKQEHEYNAKKKRRKKKANGKIINTAFSQTTVFIATNQYMTITKHLTGQQVPAIT
jgi:hypothetical protein